MTSNSIKYQDLGKRLITGFSGAAVGIFCIAYSSWTYGVIFLLIMAVTQLEFYSLLEKQGRKPLKIVGLITGLLLFVLMFLVEKQVISSSNYFILFGAIPATYLIKLYNSTDKDKFINIAYTFLGVIYVAMPISLIHAIAFTSGTYHYEYVLGLMLMLWASDVGAYFAGNAFGKHKLFERVSPGKTWEGSFGGLLLSLVFSIGMSHYHESLTLVQWIIFCVTIVIFGAYGDLVESLFKRSISIKDSGSKLPGHGGFLDRFDGLLVAVPVLVILFRVLFF